MVSLICSAASVIVALVALVFSIIAWQQPKPADPRAIPSFGSGDDAELIDGWATGEELFEFLNENEGRMIRLVLDIADEISPELDQDTDFLVASELVVPGPDCPEVPISEISSDICDIYSLRVETEAESGPLFTYQEGSWELRGYFANGGLVSSRMGVTSYVLYAVKLSDAVS